MAKALSKEAIEAALADLAGWTWQDDKLHKRYTFGDFREAVSFIVRVAFAAEAQDHHPELSNVYNRVDIALTTHDAGDRVTDKDVALARAIESFSWV